MRFFLYINVLYLISNNDLNEKNNFIIYSFNFCPDQKKVKNSKIEIYDQSIESIIDIYYE